jgi:hypothetical protein
MSFAENFMLQGTFTAPATLPGSVAVNLGFLPSRVELINLTEIGDTSANEVWERVLWNSAFGSTNNYVEWHTASASTINVSNVTANGIVPYDGRLAAPYNFGPVVTATSLSKANPAVLTSAAHGLQTGDRILITGPFTVATAMNQLGGIIFTVTVTGANTVTIPINTNTGNFTATTVTTWRKVLQGPLYYPQSAVITGITAANPVVVTTAIAHGLTVGQQVRIRVPKLFGMTQINNLQGIITAVSTTTFTLGAIDSSAFTAFAWPATTSVPFTPATYVPVGSGPSPFTFGNVTYNVDVLDDATLNNQFLGFTVGAGLLQTATGGVIGVVASDVIAWTAWRADV